MSRSGFTIYFIAIVVIDLLFGQFSLQWRWLSKPLIMISLFAYSWMSLKRDTQKIDKLFLLALVAAWLGDVLLLWDGLFIYGLVSFLVMQLLYTMVFVKSRNYYGVREWIYAAALFLFLFILLRWLWPQLGEMSIPVLVYSAAISIMSWFAWTRDKLSEGYWLIWIGSLFFIASDMTIAIHRFTNLDFGGLTIMSTYCVAQFLIITGYLLYREQQSH